MKRITREIIEDGNYTIKDLLKDLKQQGSYVKVDFDTMDLIVENDNAIHQ